VLHPQPLRRPGAHGRRDELLHREERLLVLLVEGDVSPQSQEHHRRKEVRRVLLAPEHRNLQQVEGGVTGFVQENAAEVVLSADGRFLY
jgi:hypothetical protein